MPSAYVVGLGYGKELSDQFFIKTLVRVHRAGEGAPYTGIRPAGTDLGPAIPAADLDGYVQLTRALDMAVSGGEGLGALMAQISCRGGKTQIGRVLKHALDETRAQRVPCRSLRRAVRGEPVPGPDVNVTPCVLRQRFFGTRTQVLAREGMQP